MRLVLGLTGRNPVSMVMKSLWFLMGQKDGDTFNPTLAALVSGRLSTEVEVGDMHINGNWRVIEKVDSSSPLFSKGCQTIREGSFIY
jgi:hypothetical protein